MAGPLSNLRVLDLSRVLAGPWCTQMLADFGADVIKVERPSVGDDTRHWGPPWIRDAVGNETDDSAYFSSTNRNKRSIAIDLSSPAGRDLVRELAKKSDILVENYKVGDLRRYGLSYEDLAEINPRIIYCSVTGYGQDGPYASRPGYDLIFQGEGGLMSINGEADENPGGGPMKTSPAVTDIVAGLNATIGILAAVENRHATGRGQHIDISLLDTIVSFGANPLASFFTTGKVPKRLGNAHPNITPYQIFPSADGHIIIGCGNDLQYRRLCSEIDRKDLAEDPRFLTTKDRQLNGPVLLEILTGIIRQHTTSYWCNLLFDSGIPCGPINNYEEVFEHPQVAHRQLRVDLPHAAGGIIGTVRNPVRFSATPVEYRRAPPLRGQHTAEILANLLGRDAFAISELQSSGVVEGARSDIDLPSKT
ncbi:CaiB/BaiF CoA transferase family protein [Cupriavidus necator]|uniref:CaiB/BaiF CoA transferase family protein n=1 Tax=Cupriavidus necator TaxID=106590 RepID=UPI0009B83266|nr:CaiB/BaiF CoA-transferase family protein [Cupriavidus necator]